MEPNEVAQIIEKLEAIGFQNVTADWNIVEVPGEGHRLYIKVIANIQTKPNGTNSTN